jgi:hypothetical protein
MGDQEDKTAGATNEAVVKVGPSKHPEPATELLAAEAGDVEAANVRMERSGAEQVSGQRVLMERSGARTVEARSAQLDRSGVLVLQSERAVLHRGTALAVTANEARVVRSTVGAVVAGQATVEGELRTLLHVGPVTGSVRTLLDPAGAAAAGAGFGLVVLLGALLRRLIGGR